MIKIFTGTDRVRAKQEIIKYLGTDYELLDGTDIDPRDLPSIFMGASLLASERHILIRDFLANKAIESELEKYLTTPHLVALFETKLDKRSATYKAIKTKLEIKEYMLPEPDFRQVFDIYRTAKRDGRRAVKMLGAVKSHEDPIQFTGLLASQAFKDYVAHPTGRAEKRILKELSSADIQMKTTGLDPWVIIESFLLRLSTF